MNLPLFIKQENGEFWLTEDDRQNMRISYRLKEVVFSQQSPFQHVMIVDSYDFGRMLVLDGVVQTTSLDGFIYNEMISHIPLNIHPNPRKVLIIGGGDLGAAREVAKYDEVEQIDLVEIDELVVKACREHLPEVSGNLDDPRVNYFFEDGVEFIKRVENVYDVIIIDSSDPVGPATQLFEQSFYQHVHRALKADGLMVCQSESPILYFDVFKQTYRRIGQLFPNTSVYTAVIPTYPGGLWSFTVGSKQYPCDLSTKTFTKNARYVNTEILRRCFDLPQFVKSGLTRE